MAQANSINQGAPRVPHYDNFRASADRIAPGRASGEAILRHGDLRVALLQLGAVLNAASERDSSAECSLLITAGIDLVRFALAEDDRPAAERSRS